MNSPKVSVIVPVYNMEKTVSKCLESVLQQSYTNIEIIVINDGSKDNSLSIIQSYSKNDSRIIVVSRENKGLSLTLKEGIELATSEFLMFLDSDDYIEKEMISELVAHQIKSNADMVQCSIAYRRVDGSLIKCFSCPDRVISDMDSMLFAYFVDNSINVTLAACLYRKTLYSNIVFPAGALSPDLQVAPFLLINCHSFVQIKNVLYNAVMYKDSVSRGEYTEEMYKDKMRGNIILEDFFTRYAPNFKDVIYMRKSTVAASLYYKITTSKHLISDKSEKLKECKKMFKDNYPMLKQSPLWISFSRKEKLKLKLFNIHPYVYVGFINLYGNLIKTYKY